MSTSHVSWGSIELLHNVIRTLGHLNTLGAPFPTVTYRAKIKLHGSNCGIQVTSAGVFAQSRTQMLTPGDDYKGFAAWVKANEAYFAALPPCVVFGEWCGPGVEKGTAISRASAKQYCVFSVEIGGRLVYEPAEIRALLPAGPENLHVLPWEGDPVTIAFGDKAALETAATVLSDRVLEVEREDPWVKRVFGVSGIGEGLVMYPVEVDGKVPDASPEPFAQLMFKAKGEKHRGVGSKVAVQVDAAVATSIDAFVAMVVTEARLQQGLSACGGVRDPKTTGAFLSWIEADVKKETVAELEASGLTWPQVEKAVKVFARTWFLVK
jgi:hypothetical protein